MEDWETNTSVINETVLTVREYLASTGFERTRKGEISAVGIREFLGSGWKMETIESALATIRDDEIP